jgi:hypothetical protein
MSRPMVEMVPLKPFILRSSLACHWQFGAPSDLSGTGVNVFVPRVPNGYHGRTKLEKLCPFLLTEAPAWERFAEVAFRSKRCGDRLSSPQRPALGQSFTRSASSGRPSPVALACPNP